MRRAKILATLGPASSSEQTIEAMLEAGVNAVRINMSHGTHEEKAEDIKRARTAATKLNVPLAVLVDLSGPKIRTRQLKDGKPVTLNTGAQFTLTTREILGDESNAARAAEVSQWLHEQLSSLIRNEQVTLRPTDKMILSAAHLVERGKVGLYREKLAEMRQNRADLHFLLSGPWPPYSFANIELELKTQFGVS